MQCFKCIGESETHQGFANNATFNAMLARLGNNWDIDDDMFSVAGELTYALYCRSRLNELNELRFHLLKARCGSEGKLTNNTNVGITNMPSCNDSLREHVRRGSYQVVIWKQAHVTKPDVPNSPTCHGWVLKDNILEPLWTSGNKLLKQIVDIQDAYEEDEE